MNEITWEDAALRAGEAMAPQGPEGYYSMDPSQWLSWFIETSNKRDTERQERRSDENKQDAAVEPAAWGAIFYGRERGICWGPVKPTISYISPDCIDEFPLYRHPQPTLTDAERDVLEFLKQQCKERHWVDVVGGLLDRLG